jgi:hypothetical protein
MRLGLTGPVEQCFLVTGRETKANEFTKKREEVIDIIGTAARL